MERKNTLENMRIDEETQSEIKKFFDVLFVSDILEKFDSTSQEIGQNVERVVKRTTANVNSDIEEIKESIIAEDDESIKGTQKKIDETLTSISCILGKEWGARSLQNYLSVQSEQIKEISSKLELVLNDNWKEEFEEKLEKVSLHSEETEKIMESLSSKVDAVIVSQKELHTEFLYEKKHIEEIEIDIQKQFNETHMYIQKIQIVLIICLCSSIILNLIAVVLYFLYVF